MCFTLSDFNFFTVKCYVCVLHYVLTCSSFSESEDPSEQEG